MLFQLCGLSTTLIAPAAALPVSASINEAIRPAMEFPSTDLSHQPSITRATSSAVKSSPLFHLTPLRTFRVYFVASELAVQPSNRFGVIEPSLLYSTKYSSVPAVKCASCVQSKVLGSFECYTFHGHAHCATLLKVSTGYCWR